MELIKVSSGNHAPIAKPSSLRISTHGTRSKTKTEILQHLRSLSPAHVESLALEALEWGADNFTAAVLVVVAKILEDKE